MTTISQTLNLSNYTVGGPSFRGTFSLGGMPQAGALCNQVGALLQDGIFTNWIHDKTGVAAGDLRNHEFTLAIQDSCAYLTLGGQTHTFNGLQPTEETMTTALLQSKVTEELTHSADPKLQVQANHLIPIIQIAQSILGTSVQQVGFRQDTNRVESGAIAAMERMHKDVVTSYTEIIHHLIDKGYRPEDLPSQVKEAVAAHLQSISQPSATEEVIRLREELAKAQEALKAAHEQQAQTLLSLNAEIDTRDQRITNLESQLHRTKEALAKVTTQETELQDKVDALNEQISAKNDEIASLKSQIGEVQGALVEVKAQGTELQNEVDTLKAERTAMDTALQKAQAAQLALNEQISAKNKEVASLESQIGKVQGTLAEVEAKETSLQTKVDALQAESKKTNAALQKAQAELQRIEDAHTSHCEELATHQAQLANDRSQEAAAYQEEIAKLEHALAEAKEKHRLDLQSASTQANATIQEHLATIDALERELENFSETFALSAKELHIEVFGKENENLTAELNRVKNALIEARAQLEAAEIQIPNLIQALKKAQSALEVSNKQKIALQANRAKSDSKFRAAQDEIASIKRSHKAAIQELKQTIAHLESEESENRAVIENLETQKAEATASIKQLSLAKQELETKSANLEALNDELNAELIEQSKRQKAHEHKLIEEIQAQHNKAIQALEKQSQQALKEYYAKTESELGAASLKARIEVLEKEKAEASAEYERNMLLALAKAKEVLSDSESEADATAYRVERLEEELDELKATLLESAKEKNVLMRNNAQLAAMARKAVESELRKDVEFAQKLAQLETENTTLIEKLAKVADESGQDYTQTQKLQTAVNSLSGSLARASIALDGKAVPFAVVPTTSQKKTGSSSLLARLRKN